MHPLFLTSVASLVAFLSTVGAALPYPILAPLFAGDATNELNHFLDLPPKLLLAVALTINPLGLLIGTAMLGPLSDRLGRRPLLLGTSLAAAAGHALTAVALLMQSYPLFIAARFATGLMEGNASVARALLADRLDGAQRVQAFAWLNSALYSGWLAGPLIAALTLGWGTTAPFWVASVAMLVTTLCTAFAVPPDSPAPLLAANTPKEPLWRTALRDHALRLLRHSDLRQLFVIQLAFTCGVTAFYDFYPLWLVEVAQFDARAIAWLTAGLCGTMALASVAFGRKPSRQPLRAAAWFALGSALCVGAVALGHAQLGVVAIVLFGLPNALYNAVMPVWASEQFGHHGQGAVMGLWSTTFCLANILMAAIGSVLTVVDTRLVLGLGAVLSALAAWRISKWSGDHEQSLACKEAQP